MTSRIDNIKNAATFGLRMSTAVALALFIAFYLELDNPYWAGTSAGIVCQPTLGASFRKGFFRTIGTVVGATFTVVISGLFPQDRIGFLVSLGFWVASCSFGNTLTRNFSAYGFALAGYTVAIIAGDSIGDPGQAFHFALIRATEIIIGIVSAMVVMGVTDTGRARDALTAAMDALGREILDDFSELLIDPARHAGTGFDRRRSLIARVAALDPIIDQAIGESPELHRRAGILRNATFGLFDALSGWRIAESHLVAHADAEVRERARAVAEGLPPAWREPVPGKVNRDDDIEPRTDHAADRSEAEAATRGLADRKIRIGTSGELLSDAAARVSLGLAAAANGLALLTDPAKARDPVGSHRLVVADYLPATLNAVRTFVAIETALAFWIATEWPSGLTAATWVTITAMLLAPQQEKASKAAFGFGVGSFATACVAACCLFVFLPNQEGFLSLALIIGALLAPIAALSTVPALAPYLASATINFVPMVATTNPMTYDTLGFYNRVLAIVSGCFGGALVLAIVPPVPKRIRAERLVDLSVRDLRAVASGRWTPTSDRWQQHLYARLVAMPDDVDPTCNSDLVAIISVGLQLIRLRRLTHGDDLGPIVRTSLDALSRGDVSGMLDGFDQIAVVAEESSDIRNLLRIMTAIEVTKNAMHHHREVFEKHRCAVTRLSVD